MEQENTESSGGYIPIPESFWSFETGRPFTQCLVCAGDLSGDGTQYLVEKAFSHGEVVFEYALCMDCRATLEGELSRQSLKLIGNYFDEHVDVIGRARRLLNDGNGDPKPWLSQCLVKGTPITESTEYQIFGHCDGSDMLFSIFPYAISGEAIEDVVKLLSPQTKGFLDDFTGKYFGVPDGANLPTILPL